MKNRWIIMIALIFSFVLSFASHLFAEKVLYDDFSTGNLDGDKWRQREFVREIVNGQFVSKLGNRSPGMGAEISPGVFRNHLPFSNPDSISSIECDITVKEAIPDDAMDSASGAMVLGYFYNINESGGATGDIFAYLMIGQRNNGVEDLEAFWLVTESLDDEAQTKRVLGSGTISGFDPTIMNPPYQVKLSYDGDRTFTFHIGQHTDSYMGPERKRGAVTSFKSISTGINAVDGLNNGYVSATFDHVVVNNEGTAYDDFSSSMIDQTKWDHIELTREVSDGHLRASISGYGERRSLRTWLTEYNVSYFEAKVRIDSDSQLSTGANGICRLQGYFYNDSRGPGSGQDHNRYEGDVFAQVRLRYKSDGTFNAAAFVHRSDNNDESSMTELFSHTFSTPIYLDTYYTLSIRYDEAKLIFGCEDESVEYPITTPRYTPYGEHRMLRSRVNLDPGESGYLKTRVDDVYVGDEVLTGGYDVTSELWARAVLQVANSPVTLKWKMVGADITPSGDQVISGYFYADPDDFAYGSIYNPELFVKIYTAGNGWCNMAFNHVTVDDVIVYSAQSGAASPTQSGRSTLTNRLVEHQYDGVAIDNTLQTTGETSEASTSAGYNLSSSLWAKAMLQPATGPVNLIWKEVGADTTPSGDRVVSGYFYASPDDFAYGSIYNPEVFVKLYIASNGWANMAFNHVTVDGVDIMSAHNYSGLADQSGTATLSERLLEHQYDGVSSP